MPVLVKCQADYADEFDVYGFQIIDDEIWIKLQEDIKTRCRYPMELYFGTNEALTFESPEQVMECLTAINMTLDDVGVFKKFFGKSYSDSIEYGTSIISYIIDRAAGAYDDDEECDY